MFFSMRCSFVAHGFRPLRALDIRFLCIESRALIAKWVWHVVGCVSWKCSCKEGSRRWSHVFTQFVVHDLLTAWPSSRHLPWPLMHRCVMSVVCAGCMHSSLSINVSARGIDVGGCRRKEHASSLVSQSSNNVLSQVLNLSTSSCN